MNHKDDLRIDLNRADRKYSSSELLKRVLWGGLKPLFKFSPRTFFAWRVWLLRAMGAKIGCQVHIYNSAIIYFPWNLEVGDWAAIGENALVYNLGHIKIGSRATISQRVHLCAGTHDYSRVDLPLIKQPITINDNSWVCADAFVGPGVTVGDAAIVGARAVVTKDVEPLTIVAGNPARFIKKRELKA